MKKALLIFTLFMTTIGAQAGPINVDYDNGVYHIVLTGDKIKKQIEFVSSPNLITNKEAHNNSQSLLTINTGFCDPQTQKTISYIGTDSQGKINLNELERTINRNTILISIMMANNEIRNNRANRRNC